MYIIMSETFIKIDLLCNTLKFQEKPSLRRGQKSELQPQAAQTQYVSLNEYINIHMDKLLRWVVETPMD